MKNLYVRSLLALALAAAPLAVRAEGAFKVVFKAPFSFVAGSKVLPAGEYQLSEDADHVLLIRAVGNPAAATVIVYSVGAGSSATGALNFVRRGGVYYLNTVQVGDGRTVRLIGQTETK